jgi:Fe-S-cluster containining protein
MQAPIMSDSTHNHEAPHPGCCQRCGTCCSKGGPALHIADQHLVDSGKIPLKHLLTIRQGEPAFDNVTASIAPAVTDIILIKSRTTNSAQCTFYDPVQKSCRIYAQRPCECDALQCWNTRKLETIYRSQRLTRRHLLSKVKDLWELVEDHQAHCDYGYIAELASQVVHGSQPGKAEHDLLELIHDDDALRKATAKRAAHTSEMLDFLFGRPLAFTIQLFQLKLHQTEKGIEFMQTKSAQMCYRRQRML